MKMGLVKASTEFVNPLHNFNNGLMIIHHQNPLEKRHFKSGHGQ